MVKAIENSNRLKKRNTFQIWLTEGFGFRSVALVFSMVHVEVLVVMFAAREEDNEVRLRSR